MSARGLAGAVVIAMTFAGMTAVAQEREVALRDVTVVEDGRGSARVLFRLGAFPFAEGMILERAVLTVPYGASTDPRSMDLRLCPVTASWEGAGTFAVEHDAELYAIAQVERRESGGVAVFDLTIPLKAILEEGMAADGFVLTARTERGGLRGTDLQRFDLSLARLALRTSVLPNGLPPRARRAAG